MTRKCLSCNRELPINEFRFNGSGYSKNCKYCISARNKRYFINAGYRYGLNDESYYYNMLKKSYPITFLSIIAKIENGEY